MSLEGQGHFQLEYLSHLGKLQGVPNLNLDRDIIKMAGAMPL